MGRDKKHKPMKSRTLKSLPLQVHGFGVTQDGLDAIAEDFDRNLSKIPLCQKAALIVCLHMLSTGKTNLGDMIELQKDLNSRPTANDNEKRLRDSLNMLISRDDSGKFLVARALMNMLRETSSIQ